MDDEQPALFDLEALAREKVAATPWYGAPLHFTTDYYTPDDLSAAGDRWVLEHGRFGLYQSSRMWHPAIWAPPLDAFGHRLDLLTADLRCDHREPCACVGDLMHQANCSICRWHHIAGSENAAVEAWHDHAMPGWRDLPVMPLKTRNPERWAKENQPPFWQMDGAPIRTERSPHGGRHVPGRSPFGGYDLAAND